MGARCGTVRANYNGGAGLAADRRQLGVPVSSETRPQADNAQRCFFFVLLSSFCVYQGEVRLFSRSVSEKLDGSKTPQRMLCEKNRLKKKTVQFV